MLGCVASGYVERWGARKEILKEEERVNFLASSSTNAVGRLEQLSMNTQT
jgi:hypothetical protein